MDVDYAVLENIRNGVLHLVVKRRGAIRVRTVCGLIRKDHKFHHSTMSMLEFGKDDKQCKNCTRGINR